MHIFVDEAGLFIPEKGRDSWSVVGALVVPESTFRSAHAALRHFKKVNNVHPSKEFERNIYDQESYHVLLTSLADAGCTLYCIGMQGSYENNIEEHRRNKIKAVRAGSSASATEEERKAIQETVELIEKVSPQLFFQAICQIHLMYQVVNRALSYYDVRFPDALQRFNWRIDRKNARSITMFEKIIERLMTGMIYSRTTSQPFARYADLAYSFFPYFEKTEDPRFHGGINLTRMMHDSYVLRTSRHSVGLQLADLVVAGVRKCLKGNFDDNLAAAKHLGCLLVRPPAKAAQVVELFSYGKTHRYNGERAKIFKAFHFNAKPIFI